jgi:hypothetical protein
LFLFEENNVPAIHVTNYWILSAQTKAEDEMHVAVSIYLRGVQQYILR